MIDTKSIGRCVLALIVLGFITTGSNRVYAQSEGYGSAYFEYGSIDVEQVTDILIDDYDNLDASSETYLPSPYFGDWELSTELVVSSPGDEIYDDLLSDEDDAYIEYFTTANQGENYSADGIAYLGSDEDSLYELGDVYEEAVAPCLAPYIANISPNSDYPGNSGTMVISGSNLTCPNGSLSVTVGGGAALSITAFSVSESGIVASYEVSPTAVPSQLPYVIVANSSGSSDDNSDFSILTPTLSIVSSSPTVSISGGNVPFEADVSPEPTGSAVGSYSWTIVNSNAGIVSGALSSTVLVDGVSTGTDSLQVTYTMPNGTVLHLPSPQSFTVTP